MCNTATTNSLVSPQSESEFLQWNCQAFYLQSIYRGWNSSPALPGSTNSPAPSQCSCGTLVGTIWAHLPFLCIILVQELHPGVRLRSTLSVFAGVGCVSQSGPFGRSCWSRLSFLYVIVVFSARDGDEEEATGHAGCGIRINDWSKNVQLEKILLFCISLLVVFVEVFIRLRVEHGHLSLLLLTCQQLHLRAVKLDHVTIAYQPRDNFLATT